MSWLYWVYPRKAEVRTGEVSHSAIQLCLPLWNTWMSNMLGNSWTSLTTCWSVLSTWVPEENLALTPCCLPEEVQAPTMLCRLFILCPCPLLQACFLWFFVPMCTQWTSHIELLGLLQLEEGMRLGLHIITYSCGWDICCSRNTQFSSMLPTLFQWQEGQLCPYFWETGSEQKWPIILDFLQTGSVLEHSFRARCTFTVLPCLAFTSYLHNPGGSARHENLESS